MEFPSKTGVVSVRLFFVTGVENDKDGSESAVPASAWSSM